MRTLFVTLFAMLIVVAAAQGLQVEAPLVQAHRGYSELYPENTLLAFEEAYKAGADRIETDLALTEDGVVVLMHDRTVDRTTDGSGPVHVLTLEALKQLDAGSWKDPAFADERVPTLEEAIELARAYGGMLNLEVKTSGRPSYLVRDTIEAAVALIEELEAEDLVMFSSFDFEALNQVKGLNPELPVGLLDWDEPGRFDPLDVAINQGFDAWSPSAEYATRERVEKARAAGLHVYMGSAPGAQLEERLEWGVQGFSANDPAALVDYLERRGLR